MSEIWKVDNDTYHADRSCDSSSTLKVARKSLELYEVFITRKNQYFFCIFCANSSNNIVCFCTIHLKKLVRHIVL